MGLEATPARLDALKVQVCDAVLVKPAEETEECTLFMSNIDQVLAYYVETVYFYEKSPDDVVERLREALAKLLVPYHFMAGRFQLNPELGKMELHCNGAGVLFAGASCDLDLADLGDIRVPDPHFRNLVLPQVEGQTISDAPIVSMQVTRFKCGGCALGVSMSHSAVDGIAALQFFSNLCSITRGGGLQVMPQPDRRALKARSPPRVSMEHPEYVKLCDLMAAQSAFTTAEQIGAGLAAARPPQRHVYRNFEIGPGMVAALKAAACADGSVARCSTFEAVVAHLWQARTRAVAGDAVDGGGGDAPSKLFFAVDIRKRVTPPLPDGFAGNGVVSAPCVTTAARDVACRPLSFCVRVVQQAVAGVTDEYVRSTIDHGELYRGVPALFGGIFISPWWRIPFQELDFGWGKPLYAGPVVNEKVEFVLLLHNGKNDGGLNAYLALEPEQMDKFELHFRSIAEVASN